MCGPDVLRLVDIADRIVQRHTPSSGSGSRRPASSGDPWQEALRLYEQGILDEATFRRLQRLAETRALRPVDVAVAQYEARRRRAGPPSEEERALRLLKSRREQLLTARATLQNTLTRLERQIADLEARIRQKTEAARAALAQDETRARRYLEQKVRLEETRNRLQEQAKALQDDLHSLEDVLAQIEAKITELEAIHVRSTLYTP